MKGADSRRGAGAGPLEAGAAPGPGFAARIASLPEFVPIVAALTVLGLAGVIGHRVLTMPAPGHGWVDTYVYLISAHTLLTQPSTLYQATVQWTHTNQIAESPDYLYPPAGLIPFLPLAPLVGTVGRVTLSSFWLVIDVACAIAGVMVIARHLRLSRELSAVTILLVAASAPLLSEIGAVNVDGVVLLLLAVTWVDLDHGRWRAGLWIGLLMALKPVLPLVLLVPLIRGQWRAFAIACGTALALNLIFLPVIGIPAASSYLGQVLPWEGARISWRVSNLSLSNLLRIFLGGGVVDSTGGTLSPLGLAAAATALGVALRVATVAVFVVAALRLRTAGAALALAAATPPLLSGTSWAQYYIYLVPLLMWGIAATRGRRRVALMIVVALLAVNLRPGGLWTPDVTQVPGLEAWLFELHALLFAGACMVAIWVVLAAAALGRVRGDPGGENEPAGVPGVARPVALAT